MEVIYKKKRYKLSVVKCLLIEWYKLCLIIRRTYRRLIFFKEVLKKYIAILICILIYFTIITILGTNIGEYKNIFDSLWENKEVIFTSLLLPYFAATYLEVIGRKKRLIIQHLEYSMIKEVICKIILFFKTNIEDYQSIISNEMISKDLTKLEKDNKKAIYDIKELFNELDYILNEMINSSRSGIYECDLFHIFNDLKKETKNISKIFNNKHELKQNNTNEFEMKCNIVLHNISWNWIRDNDVNNKIEKIIMNKYNEIIIKFVDENIDLNCYEKDFYKRIKKTYKYAYYQETTIKELFLYLYECLEIGYIPNDEELQLRFRVKIEGKFIEPNINFNLQKFLHSNNIIGKLNVHYVIGIGGGNGAIINKLAHIRINSNEGRHANMPHAHIYKNKHTECIRIELTNFTQLKSDRIQFKDLFKSNERKEIINILKTYQREFIDFYEAAQRGEAPKEFIIEYNNKEIVFK